jgi:hypothetical protein
MIRLAMPFLAEVGVVSLLMGKIRFLSLTNGGWQSTTQAGGYGRSR